MHIITGKGMHSRSNTGVLLPAVKRLLSEEAVPFKELAHGGELTACVRQSAPLHLLR